MVGNRRVKFWKDKWYGNELLYVFFPSLLYALAISKEPRLRIYGIIPERGVFRTLVSLNL